MRIAVLAVQGAFIEHEYMLERLGAECIELRQKSDLNRDFDGIVLPGGESTVQGKLLRELDMFDTLKEHLVNDMPVLGTCAGLILLAKHLENDPRTYFATLPVSVRRNAYGRQLGSFSYQAKLHGAAEEDRLFPLEFIRAPYIEGVSEGYELAAQTVAAAQQSGDEDRRVYILTEIDKQPADKTGSNIVGVRYRNQIGVAFHPELTDDTRCHQMFLSLCGM